MKHAKIRLIFQITFLLIISNQICGAAGPSSSKTQELYINNQSDYPIKIITPDLGRISPGEIKKVTPVPPKIEFHTAGDVLSKISRLHVVNIAQNNQSMLFDPNDVLELIINTQWGIFRYKLEATDKRLISASLSLIPTSGNPWDVFPQLKYWYGLISQSRYSNITEYAKSLDARTLARYVINLEEGYTKDQLDKKYRTLNLLWHPDKLRQEAKPFGEKVTKIINRAKEILKTGQGNFSNLF